MAALLRRRKPAAPPQTPEALVGSVLRNRDVEMAAMAAVRPLLRRGRIGRLRTVAQLLQRDPRTSVAGDVARAMVALHDDEPRLAWKLLAAHDPARVLRLAPMETVRAACLAAPDDAVTLLTTMRDGGARLAIGPRGWLAIARAAFAIRAEELSAWALDRADAPVAPDVNVSADVEWLRGWHGRLARREQAAVSRQVAFGLLDDAGPEGPADLSPATAAQRRAVLGTLDALGREAADSCFDVSRDAPSYADVPAGTWLIVIGRLPQPLFGIAADAPYDDRYRPVFASIRVGEARTLTPAILDQLRRCAPVGCADWDTYYLMRAADVPAFVAEQVPDVVGQLVRRILDGADEEQVRAAWADSCGPAVAAGLAADAHVVGLPPIGLDIEAACHAVRRRAVTIERSEAGPPGEEINIEFSLDGNLRDQMVVVLDSVVRRASRPVRLFVLCRGHQPEDYHRLAELFPTVSFVWLPTDEIDYGALAGMISHITVATMDRLLLPELLPDVRTVVHHDLDAVCLADLAELAAIDLQGHPIAAVTTPRARHRSGIDECRGTARRIRANGDPELARELVARSHLRHRLDYDVFNAGVLVLDLERMRADQFSREFFPYAERYGMNDQAVLNVYCGADRLALDPSWNWCPRIEDMAAPRIAHWSGPVKPWHDGWVNGQELWRDAERLAATRRRTPRANAAVR